MMKEILAKLVILMAALSCMHGEEERWTASRANEWFAKQEWLVGGNFVPSNAINQLEMWQEFSFDAARIDLELSWAENIGMNTMRVFLHDLLWAQDASGFKNRLDAFLDIASTHKIKPLLVLFDSCWDPSPALGPQHPPIPGVHNSGWVQGPGAQAMSDPKEYSRLESYVKDIVGTFANDSRILGWDVWNEADNEGGGHYDDTAAKFENVVKLLPQVFSWARSANASQPLTSCVWHDDNWDNLESLNAIEKIQLTQSDIITFHDYNWPETFERRVKSLQGYGRPLICTEFMARGAGSTIDTILPIGKEYNVGMIMWGFVQGKTQTNLPWDSWDRPYTLSAPTVWFHDLLRPDGSAYRTREVDIIRALRSEAAK